MPSFSLLCLDSDQPKPFSITKKPSCKPIPFSIRSAEELQEAGIQFKKKKTIWQEAQEGGLGFGTKEKEVKPGSSFLDIEFDPKGVIKIPYFYFSDDLHSIFQNLIAFEQCYPDSPTFFTGYAAFMDDIINTAKDVQILRQSGVLEHGLGSDEELAARFNQMNRGVLMDPQEIYLYNERAAIKKFCETKWHIWRANLKRDYLKSPWAILSLLAALLLLLLTITQTVFSIYPNV